MSTTRPRRGPGRPTQPIPRETLLGVARSVFAERGYAGASMAVIAERAGLRKSSLFHHFTSKDRLYDEVFQQVLDELTALLGAAVAPGPPFAVRLDRLGESLTRHLGDNPAVARLLLREFTSRGPVLERPSRAQIDRLLSATALFLSPGWPTGAFPTRTPVTWPCRSSACT